MIKCPKCGYENKDDALYCGMCYEPFRKKSREPELSEAGKQDIAVPPKKDVCINHPDRPAQGFCAVCQRDFCFDCLQEKDGQLVCNQCHAGVIPEGTRYRQEIAREQYRTITSEKGFFRKCWELIIYPKKFFGELPQEGGFAAPIKFYLGAFGIVIGAVCLPILLLKPTGFSTNLMNTGILLFICSIVGLFSLIWLFIYAGICHIFVIMFGGKRGYQQTFRVIAYTLTGATVWNMGLYLLFLIFAGGDFLSAFFASGGPEPGVVLGQYLAEQLRTTSIFLGIIYILFWLYITFIVQVKGFKKFQILTTLKALGVVICPLILGTLLSSLIYGRKKAEVSYRGRYETKEIHCHIEGHDVLPGIRTQI